MLKRKSFYIIIFFVINLISLKCDVGVYDYKLQIKNELNYDIIAFYNTNWPDTSIGRPIKAIEAHGQNGAPLPEKWESLVKRCGYIVLHFADIQYSDSSKEVIAQHVIKQFIANNTILDSLNWTIVVP